MEVKPEDIHVRVIDQRIGVGVGGYDTVIRIFHKPTGIIIEIPRVTSSQFYDHALGMEMLEYALSEVKEKE